MEVGGEGGAYLSGADPINHSALHRFTRTSAVHFPYSEPPSGGSSPVAQAPAVLDRLSVGGHVCCRSFVLSSESSLSCLSVANVPFFSPGRSGTGCVSHLACADAHRAAFL